MDKRWTIYVLCDPRETDPIFRVHYIGCTVMPLKMRLSAHVSACHTRCPNGQYHEDSIKARWIRGLHAHGVRPTIDAVQVGIGPGSREAEAYWASHYRALGATVLNDDRKIVGVRPPNRIRRPMGWPLSVPSAVAP